MKGVQLHVLRADNEAETNGAFATLGLQHAGGLVVAPDAVFDNGRQHLVALAAQHAVPTSYFAREFVAIGGLISYAASNWCMAASRHLRREDPQRREAG